MVFINKNWPPTTFALPGPTIQEVIPAPSRLLKGPVQGIDGVQGPERPRDGAGAFVTIVPRGALVGLCDADVAVALDESGHNPAPLGVQDMIPGQVCFIYGWRDSLDLAPFDQDAALGKGGSLHGQHPPIFDQKHSPSSS